MLDDSADATGCHPSLIVGFMDLLVRLLLYVLHVGSQCLFCFGPRLKPNCQ